MTSGPAGRSSLDAKPQCIRIQDSPYKGKPKDILQSTTGSACQPVPRLRGSLARPSGWSNHIEFPFREANWCLKSFLAYKIPNGVLLLDYVRVFPWTTILDMDPTRCGPGSTQSRDRLVLSTCSTPPHQRCASDGIFTNV